MPLIPHAEIDSSPGSTVALGYVKFRVFYPQVNVPDGGEPDPAQEQVVEYFNCSIPVAPPACADGMRNGAETDVDCGGPETTPEAAPRAAWSAQLCQKTSDCDPTTTCVEDGMTGVLKCTMAAGWRRRSPAARHAASASSSGGAPGTGGAGTGAAPAAPLNRGGRSAPTPIAFASARAVGRTRSSARQLTRSLTTNVVLPRRRRSLSRS